MPNFDPSVPNDRTVLNWRLKSLIIQTNVLADPGNLSLEDRDQVVDIVSRVLYATYAAEAAGRITTVQRDAVLAAWNASYGTFPTPDAAADLLEAIRNTNSQLANAVAAGGVQVTLQIQTWNNNWI